jgi:hypothetical protein
MTTDNHHKSTLRSRSRVFALSQEGSVRFVELGEYLCEVRAKQCWRLEKLKSFDEFLENVSPNRAARLIT